MPFGGGINAHRAHHPVATVSRTLRSFYLDFPYSPITNSRSTPPVKLRIGEALEFTDLRTLAAFFENGPGQDAKVLHNVRFLSISHLDDNTVTDWRRTVSYVHEAFECLFDKWSMMRILWL